MKYLGCNWEFSCGEDEQEDDSCFTFHSWRLDPLQSGSSNWTWTEADVRFGSARFSSAGQRSFICCPACFASRTWSCRLMEPLHVGASVSPLLFLRQTHNNRAFGSGSDAHSSSLLILTYKAHYWAFTATPHGRTAFSPSPMGSKYSCGSAGSHEPVWMYLKEELPRPCPPLTPVELRWCWFLHLRWQEPMPTALQRTWRSNHPRGRTLQMWDGRKWNLPKLLAF